MKIKFKDLNEDEVLFLRYKSLYYNGEETISDFLFDELEEKLRASGSDIVNIIGHIIVEDDMFIINKEKIKFVKHDTPMLSLNKIKFIDEYIPYELLTRNLLNRIEAKEILECTPKLDGNAISIKYDDGVLVHVASRGDGENGQDYTKLNLNVPKFIDGYSGEVRAEAVISLDTFNDKYGVNSNLENKYTNARNFVAGVLTKGDIDKINDIDIIAFNATDISSFDNDIEFLKNSGFKTPEEVIFIDNKITEEKFIELYKYYSEFRNVSKYQLDGFVLKYNFDKREEIGGNNHHPFWALAVKFKPDVATTKIVDIEWSLGKNGQLTPVAILEPVQLMDSTVSKVTLYNIKWLLNNKSGIGSTITLIKSGDIIPKITAVLESSYDYNIPNVYMGKETTISGTELLVSDYKDLEEYKAYMLHNTLSIIGIKNIGLATTNRIIKSDIDLKGLLSKDSTLIESKLISNGEFKKGRELNKIIENLNIIKNVELYKLIHSMGYTNCGESISKQIANMISDIKPDFKGLDKDVINSFTKNTERIDEIKELISYLQTVGIDIIRPVDISELITFEMTGTNPSGESKKDFKERMKTLGAIHTSLKSTTNYLVVDDLNSKSSKTNTAKKNNINIITYSDFENLMKKGA